MQRNSKNKVDRKERKCTICSLDETGDEDHYLLRCNNNELAHIRTLFFTNIRTEITQLQNFSNKNVMDYCLNLGDPNIVRSTSVYIKNILAMYKEETEGTRVLYEVPTKTRSGRTIRKPSKLDL